MENSTTARRQIGKLTRKSPVTLQQSMNFSPTTTSTSTACNSTSSALMTSNLSQGISTSLVPTFYAATPNSNYFIISGRNSSPPVQTRIARSQTSSTNMETTATTSNKQLKCLKSWTPSSICFIRNSKNDNCLFLYKLLLHPMRCRTIQSTRSRKT